MRMWVSALAVSAFAMVVQLLRTGEVDWADVVVVRRVGGGRVLEVGPGEVLIMMVLFVDLFSIDRPCPPWRGEFTGEVHGTHGSSPSALGSAG